MTNAGFELSNEAIAVLFGSGGFLISFLAHLISSRAKRDKDQEESTRHKSCADRNDEQHKEFYARIQALEKAQGVHDSRIDAVSTQLDRIESMLTKIIEHIVNSSSRTSSNG